MAEECMGFGDYRRPWPSTTAGGVNGRVPGTRHLKIIMGASKLPPQITKCFSRVNGKVSAGTTVTEECMNGVGNSRFSTCNYFVKANGTVTGMADWKESIMEALGDSNIYMIGFCGKDDEHMLNLFNTIRRRVTRDDLFGVIVMVSISDKPDLVRIQQEIAHQLGFSYQQEETPSGRVFPSRKEIVITENANQLYDRIRAHPKILFILSDLHTKLDLAKLGIPFGTDHNGCKLILTSHSIEMLSDEDQMNVQRIYRV